MTKKNFNPIIKKYGQGKPIIAIIGCLHGDEIIGKKIIDKIAKEKIIKGSLLTIIGNPQALKSKKRFIDQDLNRSFPGKPKGNLEQKIAYRLTKEIKKVDFVIDIHSTITDTHDIVVIKRKNINVKKLIEIINPSKIVSMSQSIGRGSLINYCSAGISLEYAKYQRKDDLNKSLRDIKRVLISLGIIKGKVNRLKKHTADYYKVYASQRKPQGFKLIKNIKNFKLIQKGQLLGIARNKKIYAQEDFYPILFAPKSYKNIMGFKARKVNKTDIF